MEALEPADPASVGGYPLLARLGSGGMGQVFLSRTPAGRPLALKLIRPDMAAVADFETRFAREIRNSDRVRSPWSVTVVDFSPPGQSPKWLATEYVPAPSLAEWVCLHGPLEPRALRALAAELAAAVTAVHACGLAHRDIKPSNVLLARDHPMVIDFGIARAAEDTRHTRTGGVIGSPGYLAPEQASGQAASYASDIFALGAVVAFAGLGRSPFQYPGEEASAAALLYRIVHESPSLDGVPEDLQSVVVRCLAKQPEQRPNATELGDWLQDTKVAGAWMNALPPELRDELTARAAQVARLCTVPAPEAPHTPTTAPPTATSAGLPSSPTDLPLIRPGGRNPAPPPGRRHASLPYPPSADVDGTDHQAPPLAGTDVLPADLRSRHNRRWLIAAAMTSATAAVIALLLSLTDGGAGRRDTDADTTASASVSVTGVSLSGKWAGVWTGSGPGNPAADGQLHPRTDSFRVTLTLHQATPGEIAGKQVSNVTERGSGREVGCTEALELRQVRGNTAMFQAVTSHPTDRANTTLTCEKGRLYVVRLAANDTIVLGEEGAQSAGAPSRLRRVPG